MRRSLVIACFIVTALSASPKLRLDSEGQALYEIISRIEGKSGDDRKREISVIARRHMYPADLMLAFLDVFLPESESGLELEHAVKRLTKRAVAHAMTDPFSLSILSFLFSIGEAADFAEDIERIVHTIAKDASNEYPTVESLLYSTAGSWGSTLGLLGAFQDQLLHGESTEILCSSYGDFLGAVAEEAASVDVMNDLVGPALFDIETISPPLYRLTPESLEADGERLGYLVSIMKENAEAFRSSLFYGPMDVLHMMGIDDDTFTEEEIMSSADGISAASEHDIAVEIVEAIRAAAYNVHAMKYNEGIQHLLGSETCMRGISSFRRIIGSQHLLVKVLGFFLKRHIYEVSDRDRAHLTALLLSHIGVLSGTLNANRLVEMRLKEHSHPAGVLPRSTAVFLPSKAVGCAEQPYSSSNSSQDVCLNNCRQDSNCNFITFDSEISRCNLFGDCTPTESGDRINTLFKRVEILSESECWPPDSISERCIWHLNEIAASSHNHTASINWLIRHYMDSARFEKAYDWAIRSADLGSHEGKYYLGTLERTAWGGHNPKKDRALSIFWDLLLRDQPAPLAEYTMEDWSEIDKLEQDSIREIADQLGVPFDDLEDDIDFYQGDISAKLAALSGLILTYLDFSPVGWTTFISVLASLPVIYLMLRDRINLEA